MKKFLSIMIVGLMGFSYVCAMKDFVEKPDIFPKMFNDLNQAIQQQKEKNEDLRGIVFCVEKILKKAQELEKENEIDKCLSAIFYEKDRKKRTSFFFYLQQIAEDTDSGHVFWWCVSYFSKEQEDSNGEQKKESVEYGDEEDGSVHSDEDGADCNYKEWQIL
ncbi:MAG: hypothetical protein V1855_03135 [bacterium]